MILWTETDVAAALARWMPDADRRLDRIIYDLCPWCAEHRGTCQATGGTALCEGRDEMTLLDADAITAPIIRTRPTVRSL